MSTLAFGTRTISRAQKGASAPKSLPIKPGPTLRGTESHDIPLPDGWRWLSAEHRDEAPEWLLWLFVTGSGMLAGLARKNLRYVAYDTTAERWICFVDTPAGTVPFFHRNTELDSSAYSPRERLVFAGIGSDIQRRETLREAISHFREKLGRKAK